MEHNINVTSSSTVESVFPQHEKIWCDPSPFFLPYLLHTTPNSFSFYSSISKVKEKNGNKKKKLNTTSLLTTLQTLVSIFLTIDYESHTRSRGRAMCLESSRFTTEICDNPLLEKGVFRSFV